MPKKLPHCSHKCSHIARKRGVYFYRRRLPGASGGEVAVTLKTRHFREAEHRAALVDGVFDDAWRHARMTGGTDQAIQAALRDFVRDALERDLQKRLVAPTAAPIRTFGYVGENERQESLDMELGVLDEIARGSKQALIDRDWRGMSTTLDDLMQRFRIPEEGRARLGIGILEANVHIVSALRRRYSGDHPMVFEPEAPAVLEAFQLPPSPVKAAGPLVSALVEPFFARRGTTDGATNQVMAQERATLRRFIEVCGDRPADEYGRGDVLAFLDQLRRLPKSYGKSPRDKDRPLAEIIAQADASGAARLEDKTVKRHLSALSQFFQTAVDRGHLSVTQRKELVEGHRFRAKKAAREQRDSWSEADLKKLFASPVWTGSASASRRSMPGPVIIRDARFWLPLLALFHGARLEEFADLYRRDVKKQDGIWHFVIEETETRRLKTINAARIVPVHPELQRLGFLEYVATTAPAADDPLFPDLRPQGADKKRGPRITRWFVEYRRAVGVYREGVAMHAFRHTARTRLGDLVNTVQEKRNLDFLFGHSSDGGEGNIRYDKGPGLAALAATLKLLNYPEIALAHLHTYQSNTAGGSS